MPDAKNTDVSGGSGGGNSSVQDSSSGGAVQAVLLNRDVMMYGITKEEISSISTNATERTVFFSIGAMMLSFSGAVWFGVQVEGNGALEQMTPQVQVLYNYGIPVTLLLAIPLFLMAGYAWRRTSKTINRIKSESRLVSRNWERVDSSA